VKVVIVTGSRQFTDVRRIWDALDDEKPDLVVHGGYEGERWSRGADSIAEQSCKRRQVDSHVMRAKWHTQRLAAGPIRNRRMLEAYPSALVLAFPLDGPGTRDCMKQAKDRGHEVKLP